MEKMKGVEYAPGNILTVIDKMLDALNGRLEDWELDPENDVSRSYTKYDLINNLRINRNSQQNKDDIIKNLLGMGILKNGSPENVRHGSWTKLRDVYVIDIKKLQTFNSQK